ncbi:MAG: ABC-type transport auxiliary lipoprotein family protein [Erythrobacter sp.]|jgi:cholesterol transport system auxiliary component|nr:ABC-type transport auxiliary lipoprotein family protein [Erythrobacter sp.]
MADAANTVAMRGAGAALALALSVALAGCVSLGAEVPESLLTLSPETTAPTGAGARATTMGEEEMSDAIAVLTPEVPAKLDVLRVPVNVSPTQIAYLAETFWVEKPARLFRSLLGEALRARSGEEGPFVLDSDDTPLRARTFLRGTLSEMSYDPEAREAIVRFDAIRSDGQGNAVTRRFEAREAAAEADPAEVGPALNRAANRVANDVAAWMME